MLVRYEHMLGDEFDAKEMAQCLELMRYLRDRCERENLQPSLRVLEFLCSELEEHPVQHIPTLSEIGKTFLDMIQHVVNNHIFEVEAAPSKRQRVHTEYVSLPRLRTSATQQLWDCSVWLCEFNRFNGVSLIDDVPRRLSMLSQEELRELIEFLYRRAGHEVSGSAALCEHAFDIPSVLYFPSNATHSNKHVGVKRVDFELTRLTPEERQVEKTQDRITKEKKMMTSSSPLINHAIGFALPKRFRTVAHLAKWIREHDLAPDFVKQLTLGDIVTIINWLRVKQIVEVQQDSEILMHNPLMNYPIVRHFICSCSPHIPQWRCCMYHIKSNGDIFYCEDVIANKKKEAEQKALDILLSSKEEKQKTGHLLRQKTSIHTISREHLQQLRLDILLFLQRQPPMIYVEYARDANNFSYQHAHVDYLLVNTTHRGKTHLEGKSRVAKMILDSIDQAET